MLERLTLGDTLNFTTTVADYPASEGWTLNFCLRPIVSGVGEAIDLTSTADGDDHVIQETAATTAAWTDGAYSWFSYVKLESEEYRVASGSITLLPDPRTATVLDIRTPARIALDQAQAAFRSWTPTMRSYTIGGRSMVFNSTADILPLIDRLKVDVKREERAERMAKGLADPRRIYLRSARA
jgi:hypothetical protein